MCVCVVRVSFRKPKALEWEESGECARGMSQFPSNHRALTNHGVTQQAVR